ncbi:MAG: diacylglycerol kinase [Pseudomonadota bacterium]
MTIRNGMPEKGFAHIWKAFGFSLAGLRVLLGENAARMEIVFFACVLSAFALSGAPFVAYAIQFGLFVFILMIEAINTAIELIVDRTSPEISEYGKHTKDVASFAVMCSLIIFGGHALWVVTHAWL